LTASSDSRPPLGCIADDYTGGVDLAAGMRRAGARVAMRFGVPDLAEPVPRCDAVVVALKTRALEPAAAVRLSLAAREWLVAGGAGRVYFKYCSTFDSSDRGNIGVVADALLDAAGEDLRTMRDATRGGVATVLNELARASGVGVEVRESEVPVLPEVAGACELLGIDPMYVANEGVLVACVAPEAADAALAALRAQPGCEAAAEIAEVREEPPGMVLVATAFGGRRVMDLLAGDPLPRIC
jgi:hydrogenase expression/formation protein HypE